MEYEHLWMILAAIAILLLYKSVKPSSKRMTSIKEGNITAEDITSAINDGNKVLAIKYYRILHGAGLKEAKYAVDELMLEPAKSEQLTPQEDNVTAEDITSAINEGNKLHAIKYYRIFHGVSLKEAKDTVEELMLEPAKSEQLTPQEDSVTEEDITSAINEGNKLLAIKYYRIFHGVGLKEAKEAIDELSLNQ